MSPRSFYLPPGEVVMSRDTELLLPVDAVLRCSIVESSMVRPPADVTTVRSVVSGVVDGNVTIGGVMDGVTACVIVVVCSGVVFIDVAAVSEVVVVTAAVVVVVVVVVVAVVVSEVVAVVGSKYVNRKC